MQFKPSTIAAVMNLDLLHTMPGLRKDAFELIRFIMKNAPDAKFDDFLKSHEKIPGNAFYSDPKIKFISSYLREKYPTLQSTIRDMSLTTISEDNFCNDLNIKMVEVEEVSGSSFKEQQNAYARPLAFANGKWNPGTKTAIAPNNTAAGYNQSLVKLTFAGWSKVPTQQTDSTAEDEKDLSAKSAPRAKL